MSLIKIDSSLLCLDRVIMTQNSHLSLLSTSEKFRNHCSFFLFFSFFWHTEREKSFLLRGGGRKRVKDKPVWSKDIWWVLSFNCLSFDMMREREREREPGGSGGFWGWRIIKANTKEAWNWTEGKMAPHSSPHSMPKTDSLMTPPQIYMKERESN